MLLSIHALVEYSSYFRLQLNPFREFPKRSPTYSLAHCRLLRRVLRTLPPAEYDGGATSAIFGLFLTFFRKCPEFPREPPKCLLPSKQAKNMMQNAILDLFLGSVLLSRNCVFDSWAIFFFAIFWRNCAESFGNGAKHSSPAVSNSILRLPSNLGGQNLDPEPKWSAGSHQAHLKVQIW